jgi:glycosyltransferase involved in cell wall biosynthesis
MNVIRLSTSKKGYGGNIYELMVDQALSKSFHDAYQVKFNLFRLKGFARLLEAPLYLIKNFLFAANSKALRIRTFQTAFFNLHGPGATIVYHIDSSHSPRAAQIFQDIVERWFYFWISKNQHLVVISQYWLNFLHQKGFRNVHLIYCGFDLKEYQVSRDEVETFKQKYELQGKIVYIGNPQRKKGTHLVYDALKDQGYTLICSGEGDLEIPVRQLKLGFREYLCLLKASTVVVTMSQFLEGWNRVAHEAMLLGTPVVGSGLGGMSEVLIGGKQIICSDFSKLVECVKTAEKDRAQLVTDGYRFAIQFPVERFQKAWVDLVKTIAMGPIK